jgi:hypothetical protein
MTGEPLGSAVPFDLISDPDEASRGLRDALVVVASGDDEALAEVGRDALDLVTGLLLLRRALVVVMQSAGMEAVALPFTALGRAALTPLRVVSDGTLPGVLQVYLPGAGVVHGAPTPGAGWDSEGETEAERLRAGLGRVRDALLQSQGRDTVLALVTAALRT